jgi:hypothetical protein
MEGEELRAAILARGVCEVPVRGRSCEQVKGRCTVHTEAWHRERECVAMQLEDDASCVAERGRCGVVSRGGGRPCEKPKGRCKYHAAEEVRCKSALEDDLGARCRTYREDGSDFCAQHQERPNFCLALKDFFRECMGGPIITEAALNSWDKRRFPNAAPAVGPIYNFPGWISKKAVMCGFEIEGHTCKAQSAGGASA